MEEVIFKLKAINILIARGRIVNAFSMVQDLITGLEDNSPEDNCLEEKIASFMEKRMLEEITIADLLKAGLIDYAQLDLAEKALDNLAARKYGTWNTRRTRFIRYTHNENKLAGLKSCLPKGYSSYTPAVKNIRK